MRNRRARDDDFFNIKRQLLYAGNEKNETFVGLILYQDMEKSVLEDSRLSDRIRLVKPNGAFFFKKKSILVVEAPIAERNSKEGRNSKGGRNAKDLLYC